MAVKKGDTVHIDYVGTLEDGKEFDSSKKHGKPLEFVAGSGMVIKGFDQAVIGMKKGEEKTFTLPPEEAYGERREELVRKVPRSQLPPDHEPEVGMLLGVSLPNGMQIPGMITEVGPKEVKIDLNPPLAGKTLTFKITIVGIKDNPSQKARP